MAVVEDVVEGVGVAAFLERFLGDDGLFAMAGGSVDCGVAVSGGVAFGGGSDTEEAGALEDGVEVAEFGQGFDPWPGAGFAGFSDESGGDAGSAPGGMEDDSGEVDELTVEGADGGAGAAGGDAEELVTLAESERGGGEDADADGVVVVPEEGDEADDAEVVGAVMPPREVRVVRFGAEREVEVREECEVFFFTSEEEGGRCEEV